MSMSTVRQTCKYLTNFLSKHGEEVWNSFRTMAGSNDLLKNAKKIGTHNGVFHCDEALACYMLKTLPEFRDAEIIRTRDESILATCDVVVDVGGIFNPKVLRFDHHQRDFSETLSTLRPDLAKNKNIKLSSAGLIYAHYGVEVIGEILAKHNSNNSSTDCLEKVFIHVYENLIEELDAIDNGVPMYPDGSPRYRINTHLSARVHRLNPEWNSVSTMSIDEIFKKAMDLVGSEFTEAVLDAANVWWPAREIVRKAIENRKTFHESGSIIELGERCPWKEHLHTLEEEMKLQDEIKFCIFHDQGGSFRVQGVPLQPESFICRVFLKSEWRGVRDEELSNVTGIKGCIFVHSTGFIGGNKTKEGALEMAEESLKAAGSS